MIEESMMGKGMAVDLIQNKLNREDIIEIANELIRSGFIYANGREVKVSSGINNSTVGELRHLIELKSFGSVYRVDLYKRDEVNHDQIDRVTSYKIVPKSSNRGTVITHRFHLEGEWVNLRENV